MRCYSTRKVTDDLIYVGGSDRRLSRFENLFPIPDKGDPDNSYVLTGRIKNRACLHTADESISRQYIRKRRSRVERPSAGLHGCSAYGAGSLRDDRRQAAPLSRRRRREPVPRRSGMHAQFYGTDVAARALGRQEEGDKLSTGRQDPAFCHGAEWRTGRRSWSLTTRRTRSCSLLMRLTCSAHWQATFLTTRSLHTHLDERCPPLLHQHCRQVRRTGARAAQEGGIALILR